MYTDFKKSVQIYHGYKGEKIFMIITIVVDQYGNENNGTTISLKRFSEQLRKNGHTVRVASVTTLEGNDYFQLEEKKIPLFQGIIHSQGFQFAKPQRKVLERAIEGSDVVHLALPFKAEKMALKIANEKGIAVTAAFHCQPENITYSAKVGKSKLINNYLYSNFRRKFYDKIKHMHCPTEFIADQLRLHKYKNTLHVISNGVDEKFVPKQVERPKEFSDKILIMMIGRYSHEKRQDVLIEAVKHSKYADKIQLIFAGKGPLKEHYEKLGSALKNKPQFNFYTKEQLVDTLNFCDLYVHSSDIEIEAIAAIEAFSTGLVPIIANSPLSATKQFAKTQHNLFEAGNPVDLAKKIDFLIDNPQVKAKLREEYIEYGKQFSLKNSVEKAEQMFRQAILDNKKQK